MNIHPECLPCVVNQAVRTARMTGAKEPEELYRKIFAHMSQLDFQKTNPEIIGETFAILKAHLGIHEVISGSMLTSRWNTTIAR